VRGPSYEGIDGKEPQFNQLRRAIKEHCLISFEYRKPDGPKMVDALQPYKLVSQGGIWYLAAMDGDKLKNYAFSKIDRLLVSTDTFTPDPAIHQVLAEEDSIWLNLKKTEVVLKVTPPAADYFKRRKLIGGQKTVKELEDGGLIISGLIAHPDQVLPIVRYWIPNVRVISPEGLQAELESQLRAYLGDP
jgi:predicted DNA-binding transcriptional regulator YafY